MAESVFSPRPAAIIDWPRQYDCGPSDEHLHAIGQFVANYSMVEWQIAGLFSHFLGIENEEAQKLIVDANISMAGIERFVRSKVKRAAAIDVQASADLLAVLGQFDQLSAIRHRIVHWQWGLNEGDIATQTNLVRPRANTKDESITLTELRDHCLMLMKIFKAISMNMLVLTGQYSRELLLAAHAHTSPEKLFRA